jgi:hypothetical protein
VKHFLKGQAPSKPEIVLEWRLEISYDGQRVHLVCNETGADVSHSWYILTVSDKGITLTENVHKSLGLPVDKNGKVLLHD